QHQACCLLFELRGKRASLLAHQTPLHGEHSRLNQCPGTLNHYRGQVDLAQSILPANEQTKSNHQTAKIAEA
ncbi:hypothetical protein, partial [Janthinobacterium violaceinigrum]|uniref:hypothetical protein n=1 Tax=Janthinobacterium violaceinigrum TaxID=2654252 RepID=UPI001D025CF1